MKNISIATVSLIALGCSTSIEPADKSTLEPSDTETSEENDSSDDGSDSNDSSSSNGSTEDPQDDDTQNNDTQNDDTQNDDTQSTDNPNSNISFSKVELFNIPGGAWLQSIDLDGDGYNEYLLNSMSAGVGDWPSFIGAGEAYILSRNGGAQSVDGTLGTWTATTQFDRTYQIDWPNDSSLFDVNNDGLEDWVVGTGFIPMPNGGIIWMEGALDSNGALTFDIPDYIETPWTDHFYHKAYPGDFDNDGDMDFVTTNYKNAQKDWLGNETEPGLAILELFENNGVVGEASFTRHQIGERGGSLLTLHDVDEDGDMDAIIPQYFNGSSLIWMENPGTVGPAWTEHTINNTTGKGFDVELADMNGDGRLDVVYGNHNHQLASDPADQTMGIYWFEIPTPDLVGSLSNWDSTMNVVFEGFYVDEMDPDMNGAPGVFHTGDINSDGLMDVSVSGDGDDGLYVFVQELDGSFTEVLIDAGTIMAGDHEMTDIDGDGDMDFIWAIYGDLDLLSGQLAPSSAVNVYLQEAPGTSPSTEGLLTGDLNFVVNTSFGADTCEGAIEMTASSTSVSGNYQCSFGILGAQNHSIVGTVDSNGNITGTIDLTVSFSGSTYSLPWTGTYDGTRVQANTADASSLDGMEIDYTLSFIVE
ncbi:MAG: hypothetical protein CMK59_09550 [Proteobacteria bacterium]|nr:hypothetical protein [Pseudomonadota bacterium]